MDGPTNPLAFFELLIVLAFAIGYVVLDRFANRYDGGRGKDKADNDGGPSKPDDPA